MQTISPKRERIDISRPAALILVALLLIGATWCRANRLTNVPAGYAFDSTWDLADGLRISRDIPFPAYFDTRSEPAHRWMIAAAFLLLGPHQYSAQVLQIFIALLAVAATYTAGLVLLAGNDWRRLGSLIAAGAVAASVPNLFVSRIAYHAALVAPVVALTAALLLRAARANRTDSYIRELSPSTMNRKGPGVEGRLWLLAGFVGGLGVHTYQAGIVTPVWVIGFVIHRLIFVRPRRWSSLLWTAIGLLPPLMMWFILIALVPDLFFRLHEAGGDTPYSAQRVVGGFVASFREFFLTGYPLPLYNTPSTPILNPVLALLALVGVILAVWRWRRATGALLLGGVAVFILPAALSEDPLHPVRLIGTLPLLALLAGWGAAWLVAQTGRWRIPRIALYGAVGLLIVGSLVYALRAYQDMFADPARYDPPGDWYSVPHNYMIAHAEALEWLETVDQPTYVSISVLDSPAAYYILQREAFLTVTTWTRYPLTELPTGQFFAPIYDYYHTPLPPNTDPCTALLLPAEKTIVILPCSAAAPLVTESVSAETRPVKSTFGWDIARVTPVAARTFAPPQFTGTQTSVIGHGLELIGEEAPTNLQAGQPVSVVLHWRVNAPQPADIFSVAQLLSLDYGLYGNSDHHTLGYLYPSARWQVGDIIPDFHQINVSANLPQGVFRWAAGAHVPPDARRLSVTPPNSDLNDLWLWGAVRNPPPVSGMLPASMTTLDAHFADHITLAGYCLNNASDTWTLTLFWQVDAPPQGDYTIFVHALVGDQIVAQHDSRPDNGQLPTWSWSPGEVITTAYTLNIPPGVRPDSLYVGMYAYPSLQRLAVTQNGTADNRVYIATGQLVDTTHRLPTPSEACV